MHPRDIFVIFLLLLLLMRCFWKSSLNFWAMCSTWASSNTRRKHKCNLWVCDPIFRLRVFRMLVFSWIFRKVSTHVKNLNLFTLFWIINFNCALPQISAGLTVNRYVVKLSRLNALLVLKLNWSYCFAALCFFLWTFITNEVVCMAFGKHSISVIFENCGASTSETADGCNFSFCYLIQLLDKYLCINNINMKFKPICGFTGSRENIKISNICICWNI